MTRGTREVAEELLARIAKGDHEHTAALFAEPVDWALTWPKEGHPATPWIRDRSSLADVADHFRGLADHHVAERNDSVVYRIVVDGSDAVVLGELRQTARSTGIAFTSPFAPHLVVENGLITGWVIYEDSLTVARAHAGS
jgi:uncharacterized protein